MQQLHDFVCNMIFFHHLKAPKQPVFFPDLKHPNGPVEQNIIIKQMKLSPLCKPLPMLPSVAGEHKRRTKSVEMCSDFY